jgi:hypothetical protein
LSKNEVAKLKSLHRKQVMLCPELDGLQAKYRIKRTLKGKTHEERVEELIDRVANEKLIFDSSYKDAKLVSLIFLYEPFSPMEVFGILCKNRYR